LKMTDNLLEAVPRSLHAKLLVRRRIVEVACLLG
jgi:hypothetical protein